MLSLWGLLLPHKEVAAISVTLWGDIAGMESILQPSVRTKAKNKRSDKKREG